MRHFLLALAFVLLGALAGCSGLTGIQRADAALTAACSEANGLLSLAGLIPGGGQIATYIQAGCNTAEGLAKLAADPSSAAWVGALIERVKALAKAAGRSCDTCRPHERDGGAGRAGALSTGA